MKIYKPKITPEKRRLVAKAKYAADKANGIPTRYQQQRVNLMNYRNLSQENYNPPSRDIPYEPLINVTQYKKRDTKL